jgi:hypothetical protein
MSPPSSGSKNKSSKKPARKRVPPVNGLRAVISQKIKALRFYDLPARRGSRRCPPSISRLKGLDCSLSAVEVWARFVKSGLAPLYQEISHRRPGFDCRSGHAGFLLDEVTLGQVSSEC